MTKHALSMLTLLASALTLAAGCAPAPTSPSDEAADQLLFSLPGWCGRERKRKGWTHWANARQQAPSGSGICGATLSAPDGQRDDGLCVVYEAGEVASIELRRRGERVTLTSEPAQAGWGAWHGASFEEDGARKLLVFRLDGAKLAAHAEGNEVSEGPCFWRAPR